MKILTLLFWVRPYEYNFRQITKAVRLIMDGASFIATNPDPTGPSEYGVVPACGAMAALIEKACGRSPFYCGKPSPIYDARSVELSGSTLRKHGYDRRPYGY